MTNCEEKVEQIINNQSKDLENIGLEVCKGIQDGVRLGTKSGTKRGFKKGLKACMLKGPRNITQANMIDSVDNIKVNIIVSGIMETSKFIFDKVAKQYVESIYPKIAKELEKADIAPSTEGTKFVEDLVIKSQKKSMAKMMHPLPTNPLYGSVSKGINTAIETSLKESLDENKKCI
jgi:hypothetical protein